MRVRLLQRGATVRFLGVATARVATACVASDAYAPRFFYSARREEESRAWLGPIYFYCR